MSDKIKILYVDDEEDIRTIVEFSLEDEADMMLKVCDSGEAALAVIVDFMPNLILLDVMMPTLDGPATLQKIRGLPDFKNTPVVFMTAKVQPQEVAQFKQMGALEVIAKPFDPMILADQVRNIWKHATSN